MNTFLLFLFPKQDVKRDIPPSLDTQVHAKKMVSLHVEYRKGSKREKQLSRKSIPSILTFLSKNVFVWNKNKKKKEKRNEKKKS